MGLSKPLLVLLWSKIRHLGSLQLQLELVSNEGDEFGIGGVLDFFFWISYTDFGRDPVNSSTRSRSGIDQTDAAEPAALTVEVGST